MFQKDDYKTFPGASSPATFDLTLQLQRFLKVEENIFVFKTH
jgi:hypothetical protein